MLNELYHSLDPVAFSAGPFTVYWYGLAIWWVRCWRAW